MPNCGKEFDTSQFLFSDFDEWPEKDNVQFVDQTVLELHVDSARRESGHD